LIFIEPPTLSSSNRGVFSAALSDVKEARDQTIAYAFDLGAQPLGVSRDVLWEMRFPCVPGAKVHLNVELQAIGASSKTKCLMFVV
jgi:hypothetical protein